MTINVHFIRDKSGVTGWLNNHGMTSSVTDRFILQWTLHSALLRQKENHRERLRECWWGTNLSTLFLIWAVVRIPLTYSTKACQSKAVWSQTHIPKRVLNPGMRRGSVLFALECLVLCYLPTVHCHANRLVYSSCFSLVDVNVLALLPAAAQWIPKTLFPFSIREQDKHLDNSRYCWHTNHKVFNYCLYNKTALYRQTAGCANRLTGLSNSKLLYFLMWLHWLLSWKYHV